MMRSLALGLVLLVGCTSRAPRLLPPESVESFCSGQAVSGAVVADIISSVADSIMAVDVPDDAVLRNKVTESTGAIGHWKSQPLYMPGTARALGVSGDYIDVTQVAITNELAGPDSRIIYVTVNAPAGVKRLALRAYDTRNVCRPGPRP
jgi:hypothetical protein